MWKVIFCVIFIRLTAIKIGGEVYDMNSKFCQRFLCNVRLK